MRTRIEITLENGSHFTSESVKRNETEGVICKRIVRSMERGNGLEIPLMDGSILVLSPYQVERAIFRVCGVED